MRILILILIFGGSATGAGPAGQHGSTAAQYTNTVRVYTQHSTAAQYCTQHRSTAESREYIIILARVLVRVQYNYTGTVFIYNILYILYTGTVLV